ncbi:aminopeptidase P family protein [Psychrobacter cryohalolentis]|uniref:Peptidase M24 n=1 Tax=Psychrobacter cryohalolentis (strain ATCC BAA-1226 / DSM 17306 / VKM B-2378 / K5) TaxID=335284 RepID=Q1Q8F3_PSYCK|nr:aminopeptidase P family protein [Psychrobacter cryohalolentis]ABE76050.1 peptidase M24 [Psychrobacter cryohalolentis K5]ASE26229.1 aminopeptidase P family protein [Psychrobacter cryohalolentis]
MNKQAIHDRIESLRQTLAAQDLTAIIVPSADPHLSEYLPEYWQARLWLSGFTGSVGTLVVTADFAGLWTDSRYWVHAAEQLDGTGITLEKLAPGQPNHIDWLATHLAEGDSVAVDGNVLSIAEQDRLLDAFEANDITLITERDLLTEVWTDRPALPAASLYVHDAQFLAQSAIDKLVAVRVGMAEAGATHHLLSSLDDIAWLTNLRGADVDYNPVFLAHMLISENDATLFIDNNKVNSEIAQSLKDSGIAIADYEAVQDALGTLTANDLLLLDPSKVAVGTLSKMADGVGFIEQMAPSTLLKSVKSDADIDHVREAMRQDGAALCEFFATFEQRLADGEHLSELDVDSMLIEVRSQQPHYVSPSFPTIAGFNENGALPHYRATPEKFSYLDVNEGEGGLLLIDSGAQYQNGTTDITRVVGIGQVSTEHKRDFTTVLKAHIALAKAHFPDGIASPLIDAICRAPLWQAQMDYGHGTGHGVGYFLNVHEGPQVIAYSASTPKERAMKEGMISSNEPGLYREGKWGIRIENLMVNKRVSHPVETEFGNFLNFETVTYCPIDTRLIEPSLLSQVEVDWLNDYHRQVYAELKNRVDGAALDWLTERTQAI